MAIHYFLFLMSSVLGLFWAFEGLISDDLEERILCFMFLPFVLILLLTYLFVI